MIKELKPLDNKIVLFGQSCVGKTTFAKELDHEYYCFDAMFHWQLIESLNLSVDLNLQEISKKCIADRYVLDGWTLADSKGEYLPDGVCVYVIYASYDKIISQYRIPVNDSEEFRTMFHRWYDLDYKTLVARYFRNEGSYFIESNIEEFYSLIKQ